MPRYCCVPGCGMRKGGHRFPQDPKIKKQWCIAIKRTDGKGKIWKPSHGSVVCREHFLFTDYRTTHYGQRRCLKKNAVPSVFSFNPSLSSCSTARRKRHENRCKQRDSITSDPKQLSIGAEVEVCTTCDETDGQSSSNKPMCVSHNKEINCKLESTCIKFSIDQFEADDKAVHYYTGFDDYQHFCLFFSILGPAVNELQYKCALLQPKDQLFLTLMKLRQAKEFQELSILFSVSETTASSIFYTWLNFLYFQLKELNIWPSPDITSQTMPKHFKCHFPQTRVILDATEVPIQKPSNVSIQSCTYSSYKNRNTLKTMVGITPRGMVSYVSDSYGGSTSDRQIIERSELLLNIKDYFDPFDSIMADRGIMVQDLFASHDIHVNTPTMLKGKSQLEPEEVIKDRRVASKRIHVERVIGLAKTYKILNSVLPQQHIGLGSRIIYVCFMMVNFRESVVGRLA